MLKKLTIENFQSHEKTTLQLHPGLNVIQGDVNQGKTAIIRALKMLFTNSPAGGNFLLDGLKSGTLLIEVETTEGHTVGLKRNITVSDDNEKKVNSSGYYLDEKEWSGFGRDVPDEVQQALALTDINIQDQLENAFMVLESPSDIARRINSILQIEQADEWVKNIGSIINSERSRGKVLASDIEEAEEHLKAFAFLPGAETLAADLKALSFNIAGLESKLQSLTRLLDEIFNCNELLKHEDKLKKANALLVDVNDLGERVVALNTEYTNLTMLVDWIKSKDVELSDATEQYKDKLFLLIGELQNKGTCPVCQSKVDDDMITHIAKVFTL